MPGGNPTINFEPLDLGSFLQRKRKPLEAWLIHNNITTEQALQNFLKSPEWSVSENLIETIRGFFISVSPAPVEAPQQVEAVVQLKEEPKEVEEQIKTQTLPPPPPVEPEQVVVVSPSEEIVSSVEEEEVADTRSAITNRERKKNR